MTKQTRTLLLALVAMSALAGLSFVGCASRNYPGPVHGLTFNGTVQSVDLPNHRLTIAPLKPGHAVTFAFDAGTKFWKNGVPIHADEVETGKSVRVHYHTAAGEAVAHHVYAQAPYAPQH